MTAYGGDIPDTQIDPESPLISDLFFKLRDNPISTQEGDPTAIAANRWIAIDYDYGSGSQTAIRTDETAITKTLKPDGSGGVEWSDAPAGAVIETVTVASGDLIFTRALVPTTGNSYVFNITPADMANSADYYGAHVYVSYYDSQWNVQEIASVQIGIGAITYTVNGSDQLVVQGGLDNGDDFNMRMDIQVEA